MDSAIAFPDETGINQKPERIDRDRQYKTLFEQVNAAVLLSTLSGTILEANVRSHDLFKYTFDEIKNVPLNDLFALTTDWTQFIEEIIAKGGIRLESEIIRKDHVILPVELSVSLFMVNNSPQMLILINDISERRRNEQRIRESEQTYHSIFESTTDGMIILDSRGEICDVNSQALRLLGFDRENVINQNMLSLGVFPQTAVQVILHQFELLLNDKKPSSHTTKLQKASGESFNAEVSSFFLCKKENEIDSFVIVIHDIKEDNGIQQELNQTKKELRSILDHCPLLIYFKDRNNRFTLVNNAQSKLFNVSSEEMIGKTEYDFLPNDTAKQIADEDLRVINNGLSILDQQRLLQTPYGESYTLVMTKIPQYDEGGEPCGLLCISQILDDHPDYI